MASSLESETKSPPLCVLGCRSQSAALRRRARSACELYASRSPELVIVCGGISWAGRIEADVLAGLLEEGGVPPARILRERTSRDTHENASEAARILRARGERDVVLVTCSWHLRRATKLFEHSGLRVVEGVGVPPPDPTVFERGWWLLRERIAAVKDLRRTRQIR